MSLLLLLRGPSGPAAYGTLTLGGTAQVAPRAVGSIALGGTAADITAPDLHTDFTGKPDGPVPATGDEGVPIVLNPSSGPSAMTVADGHLVANGLAGTAGNKASYFQQSLPGVSRMGAEFRFGADTGTNFGSITLVTWDAIIPEPYALPLSACHLTVTPGTWNYSVVTNGTTVDSVASGTFSPPLAQDWTGGSTGTLYSMTVSLYGDTAIFRTPDGVVRAITDSRIASVQKNVACFEHFRNSPTDEYMAIKKIWADRDPLPLDYTTVVTNSAPTAWYRGNGSTADAIAGGTAGVLTNGATYGAAVLPTRPAAQSFSLDGVNDYVAVADQTKLRITAPISLEAWVKPTSVSAGYHAIAGTVNTLIERGVANFTMYTTGVGTTTSSSTVTAGQVYHIVATWAGGTATLYVNKQMVAGASYTSTVSATTGFRIGSYDGASEFFDGLVSEVAWYNRALSPGEVAEHYLAGSVAYASASGSITLGGTATGTNSGPTSATATGSVTLGGAPAGQARPTTAGSVTLGGTTAGSAQPSSAGTLTLDGTAATSSGAAGISFVGAAADTTAASGSATTGSTLPSGIAAGDVILLAASRNQNNAITTPPSGFTFFRNIIDTGTTPAAAHIDLYWKPADGTETTTGPTLGVTSPTANFKWIVHTAVYRGVDNTDPFIVENGQIKSASSTAHPAPAITNTDAAAWGVYTLAFRQVSSPTSCTPPGGMTERLDTDGGIASTANPTAAWADTDGAVATGAVTYSGTSSGATQIGVAWAGFLRPAAGGGPSTATAAGTLALGGTADGSGGSVPATADGSLTLGGTSAPGARASTSGNITLAGTSTATAGAAAAGTITLGGTAVASARPSASGAILLSGTPSAPTVVGTTAGAIVLGGTATPAVAVTAAGSLTLSGIAAASSSTAAAGSITLGGPVTGRAVAATAGTIALSGTATGTVPGVNTAAGSITLGGTSAPQVSSTTAGTITLSSTSAPQAPSTTAGTITLAGTAAGLATATAAGTITLGGPATAGVTATASGTITLAGTAAGSGPGSTASGTIALSGTAAAQAATTATGSLTLSGTATPQARVTAVGGSITLAGAATGAGPGSTAVGTVTLSGTAAPVARASLVGLIVLGATAAPTARPATTGVIVLGGTASVPVPATVAGLLTLSGLAHVVAPGDLYDITAVFGSILRPSLTVGTPLRASLFVGLRE